MLNSIRARLLFWFAGVLLLVIVGFACYLYWSAEHASLQQMDVRLEGAVRYLDAAVKAYPLRELLKPYPFNNPFAPGSFSSPNQNREARLLDNSIRKEAMELRPAEKRNPDKRREGDTNRQSEMERRNQAMRDGVERMRRDLRLPPPTESEIYKMPQFFTIFKENGVVFATNSDPDLKRDPQYFNNLLGKMMTIMFIESDKTRLALFRGPERSLILVGVSMVHELTRLDTLFYQLIASGSLALFVGLLGSWYISGMIMKPVKAISATAAKLSATHLHERIDTRQVDTELKELATVLNDTFDRLEGAFQRQSRFTADAGHELRTPLAVLHTNLELALSRPRSEGEYCEILKSCLDGSSRMRTLIDSLLTLARADAGQLQSNFKSIELCQVVRHAMAQHQARAGNHVLECKLPAQTITIQGDMILMSMVLSNLISNALKYTPEHGRIQVQVDTDGKDAILKVTDNGMGIPEESLPHIFSRFFRVDQSRNRTTGGQGLGLAICKSLVDAHHGSITCESTVGRGTSFTMRFPLINPGV
ncbi:MAG: HAMP domain-containing protein [Planctomycetia bacterium]|nr:HAMP domain-containing protein [Planctomycetia bacterium]